jgi:hypothetical protein
MKLVAYLRRFNNLIFFNSLCLLIDLVGYTLWCGSTIRDIVFDPKIVVGPSRIVAGSQQNTTISFVLADDIGCRRS